MLIELGSEYIRDRIRERVRWSVCAHIHKGQGEGQSVYGYMHTQNSVLSLTHISTH